MATVRHLCSTLLVAANGKMTGKCNAVKVSSSRASSTLATSKFLSTPEKSGSSSSISSSTVAVSSTIAASSSVVTSSSTPALSPAKPSTISSSISSSSIASVSASPSPSPPVCFSDSCTPYTGPVQDSCPAGSGRCVPGYQLRCKTAYYGYETHSSFAVSAIQDCLDACTAYAGCSGAIIDRSTSTCIVLGSFDFRTQPSYSPNIDTYARLCDGKPKSSTPIVRSVSSTVMLIGSTSATLSPSSPVSSSSASPTASFCPALDETCASGYRVRCGISPNNFEVDETPGGITEGVELQACLDACTARPSCVAAYNDEAAMGCILLTALELEDSPTFAPGFDTYLKGCEDTPSLPSTPIETPSLPTPSASGSSSPTPATPWCRYLDLESSNIVCPAYDGPLANACPSEIRCQTDYQINCGQVPDPARSRPLFMNSPKSTAEDCLQSCNRDDRCVAAVYTEQIGTCDGYGEVGPLQASGDDRKTTFMRVCGARQH
jgi:hypothetical protein